MTDGWDYKTVVLTHGFMGVHKGELGRAKFEVALDELGRDGFELTWVFMDQKLQGEKDGHVLIFERTRPGGAGAEAVGAEAVASAS